MLLLGASPPSLAASMDDLLRAYPDALAGFDGANLIWRDGTRMPVADGRPDKDMAEQLRNGSILDQLRLPYPAGAPVLPPQQDPGRVRNRAFFDKMYGDCRSGQVAPKLVPVVWLPNTWGHVVRITSVNGVDHALAAVSRELDALPAQDKRYLYPLGGTYACRSVADTGADEHACLGRGDRYQPRLLRLLAMAPAMRRMSIVSLRRSWRCSSVTASSGADDGRTSTRCTSNIDLNCSANARHRSSYAARCSAASWRILRAIAAMPLPRLVDSASNRPRSFRNTGSVATISSGVRPE